MSQKLVLFGDSLFGKCSKDEQLLLEAKLQSEYDVYNCATGGWDTNDLIKKTPYIALLKPDVVIISVGTNDASPWKRVPLEQFEQNLIPIIDNFKGSRVVVFPPPPVFEASRPVEKPMPNEDIKAYYEAAVRVCEQLGVEYLHSWDIFMPLQQQGESYHVEDGVHLNDRGYEVLFDAIAGVLA